MARVHLLLCFAVLFASVTLFDVASAFLKLKPSLPKVEDPKTIGEVEGYTVKVVTIFVSDLEKECPKSSKFKAFFDKLRGFAKYVCPLNIFRKKDDDSDMKAKEDGILKTIASFAVGKIKKEIQEEKEEAIETFKFMKSLAGKIIGGRKKDEKEETMTITPEQMKEIQDGILKWQTVIIKIANTMVASTTTTKEGSDSETTTTETSSPKSGSSSGSPSNEPSGSTDSPSNKPSSSTGSPSNEPSSSTGSPSNEPSSSTGSPSNEPSSSTGSPSNEPSGSTDSPSNEPSGSTDSPSNKPSGSTDSPSNKPSGSDSGAGTPSKDTDSQSEASTKSASSGSTTSSSQTKEVTVTEVETQTSEQVMTFLMDLEKKCPDKEEYKQFFEKLKGTMTGSVKVASPKKKGLFARIKGAIGKLGDAMAFIRSRIGSKSAEIKKSMEEYQAEIIKNMEELDAIHARIVSENQNKKGGSLTCTPEQQAEIKTTITKWEQVTTQFVEVAIKSESSTTSSSSSTSSSTGKAQAN